MNIAHDFTPELQPTNTSCTQTATAMLLSHYDTKFNAVNVLNDLPTRKLSDGSDVGSSMQQLALYCLKQGYQVEMHSFDALILDFSWSDILNDELIQKLESIKNIRNVDSLGKAFTKQYIEEYIEFVQKGGSLLIKPYPTYQLLTQLVHSGPFCAAVNFTTLTGHGHTRNTGLRANVQNDTENDISTHAILVYGQDEQGDFLVSDPWGDPDHRAVSPDQLIASIMAAQWLSDNILFRIVDKQN